MKSSTVVKVIGLFLIGVALLCSATFVFGLKVMKLEIDDANNGLLSNLNSESTIKTEGTITDIKQPVVDGYVYYSLITANPDYVITYSYFDEDGDECIVSTNVFSSSVKKGDNIDVYYDKDEPQKTMPSYAISSYNFNKKIYTIIGILGFIPGIVTLIIGFVMGNKEKKKAIQTSN